MEVAVQCAEVGSHEADRIVDFMRDPGCQLAEGRQFLRLHQLAFQLLALVDLLLQGFACLSELGGASTHPVFQFVHLNGRPFGHFPFGQQGTGHLLDFNVVEGLFQDQQAIMGMQAVQQFIP
ncbi:hypothetical protein D3C73_752990 [compost metagenome]